MHQTMDISVPREVTDALLTPLERYKQVMGLSSSRGASIKPPGDVLIIHVLNRGTDDVSRLVAQATPEDFMVTAETSSIIDPKLDVWVERDIDEVLCKESEAGLRHQGRITLNFLALMALGGVLGCLALTTGRSQQATALIATSIIAPGFKPIASVMLRRWNAVQRGLLNTLTGYTVFTLTTRLTFLLLRWTGSEVILRHFTENAGLSRLAHPRVSELLLSSVGALSGTAIMAAFRWNDRWCAGGAGNHSSGSSLWDGAGGGRLDLA